MMKKTNTLFKIFLITTSASLLFANDYEEDNWTPVLDPHAVDHHANSDEDHTLDSSYRFDDDKETPQLFSITPADAVNTEIAAENDPAVSGASTTPGAATDATATPTQTAARPEEDKGILINFNNVSVIEFIRFISRVTNKNFIFDDTDLKFNVTMVSEEPTSIENIMTGLMQTLRVHNLLLMEQGNNLIIHKNPGVNQISAVESDSLPETLEIKKSDIVTRVFRLNTLDVEKASGLIKPLISEGAQVEVLNETSHIVVTDIKTNVEKIGQLLKSLDAPASGLTIGQYVVTNALLDSLISLAEKIMEPIAESKPLVFVPHTPSNSIFIVSTPFVVERTMAVLRNLDINIGETRIFTPDSLKFSGTSQVKQPAREGVGAIPGVEGQEGQTGQPAAGTTPGVGQILSQPLPPSDEPLDLEEQQEALRQIQELLKEGKSLNEAHATITKQGTLQSRSPWSTNLPSGHIERTRFYIHKLRFRKGDQIAEALSRIGTSLQESGSSNLDLISSIQSLQWLEASNSLVFTGTVASIGKVKELIEEIDTPLRQIYLEMLLLDTTIDESLNYGVNWGARFDNGNTAGSEAFLSANNALSAALDTAVPNVGIDVTQLARTVGYNLGIVGRNITRCGVEFSSIGALVSALHDKNKDDIVLNPKILVEDNATAEIFVGINAPFKTQSIANDQGSTITSNFEFKDIGTRVKVTPLISNNDVVTLEIEEEVSSVADTAGLAGSLFNDQAGPTTKKSNTTTKVHVPNRFFLVMSGMIQDEHVRRRQQVPCLGGVPVIGALFSDKRLRDSKRNLMIFIRPVIIDTEAEIDEITRSEQNAWNAKYRTKHMWKYEVEEALDLLNLKEPEVSLHDSEIRNP